jgi:hypothetical protein
VCTEEKCRVKLSLQWGRAHEGNVPKWWLSPYSLLLALSEVELIVVKEMVFYCLGVIFTCPAFDCLGIVGPLPFACWYFMVGDCAGFEHMVVELFEHFTIFMGFDEALEDLFLTVIAVESSGGCLFFEEHSVEVGGSNHDFVPCSACFGEGCLALLVSVDCVQIITTVQLGWELAKESLDLCVEAALVADA